VVNRDSKSLVDPFVHVSN